MGAFAEMLDLHNSFSEWGVKIMQKNMQKL